MVRSLAIANMKELIRASSLSGSGIREIKEPDGQEQEEQRREAADDASLRVGGPLHLGEVVNTLRQLANPNFASEERSRNCDRERDEDTSEDTGDEGCD